MTQPEAEPMSVDRSVTRVVEILREYKDESWNELFLATGIRKHTMTRRREQGGWTASEVARLAKHFNKPVSALYDGPDALFRDMGDRMNAGYSGDNQAITWDAA